MVDNLVRIFEAEIKPHVSKQAEQHVPWACWLAWAA